MGLPSVIITDQGREFHNQFNAELMSVFDIKHKMTTLYHPQANGLDERYNQTLVNSLAKYVQGKHNQWDEMLSEVVYAYNTAIQESTKYSPFEAMFGRKAKLPVDFNSKEHYSPEKLVREYEEASEDLLTEIQTKRSELEEVITTNKISSGKKLLHYYDLGSIIL